MFPWTTFFESVGIITGIATLLAVLVVIADATIANYGKVTLKINKKEPVEVDGGRSLLSTLMEEEIFIPSACGGKGSCGFCTLKVKSGGGDIMPTELPWLTEEQRSNNIRLSCQCKVKKDMEIEIPEELFNVKEYKTEVASITDLTHDIKEVTLRLLEPAGIEFKAGQFVQFEVPEYELTDEPVYRAYSIASDAAVKDSLELEIRLVPNGICTTYVHQHLRQGDKVTINGPYGDFFLRDTEREIICIAGGSGMAPIKSILHQLENSGSPRRARYFFGAVSGRDLFMLERMAGFEKNINNYTFIPALSGALPEDNWTGETGLITEVVDRHMQTGDNTEAYLCGSPGMIKACVGVLTANGVPEKLIYYDSFG